MSQRTTPVDERIEGCWEWFAVALFLLITVDLLTTFGATVRIGVNTESDPQMRWLLARGRFR